MKKFISSMVLLCFMACGICLYYRQQYSRVDYHAEGVLEPFYVATNLDYTFFMKPSELGINNFDNETKVELVDKDGNVIGNGNFTIIQENTTSEDISQADDLKRDLDNADLIIIAVPQGNFTLFHRTIQQPLYVKQVIKGEKTLENTTILLQECVQRLQLSEQLFGGCTNYMMEGKEYLVFLNNIDNGFSQVKNMYYDISPISYFRLDNVENVLLDDTKTYDLVSNNEFFAVDEVGLEKILALKKEILDKYLK